MIASISNYISSHKQMILIGCLYAAVGLYLNYAYGIYMGRVMIWNVFLGVLPYVFAKGYDYSKTNKRKGLALLMLLAWLLFFPNSIYLMTDLIHTNSTDFYHTFNYVTTYYENIEVWYEFAYISGGVFLGTMVGMTSFDKIIHRFTENWSSWPRRILIAVLALLTGLGIYLGRFLRFNSWDIIQFPEVLSTFFQQLNFFAFRFVALIALYVIFVYSIIHMLRKELAHNKKTD